jgi:N-formylglutamate amidohydrolase
VSPLFEVISPTTESPVLVEIPHASVAFPPDHAHLAENAANSVARDADLFVDLLYQNAPSLGATVIVSRVCRYVIDLNRAENDVDSGVVEGDARKPRPNYHGLIWRATTAGEVIRQAPLSVAEHRALLDAFHRPYHAAIAEILRQKKMQFGFSILVCAHSMPSVGRAGTSEEGIPRADVVPGTRGKTSANSGVIRAVEDWARARSHSLQHDRPYRGGYSTQFYGKPRERVSAIQIELARRLYMDEATLKPHAGFENTRVSCESLIARLVAMRG